MIHPRHRNMKHIRPQHILHHIALPFLASPSNAYFSRVGNRLLACDSPSYTSLTLQYRCSVSRIRISALLPQGTSYF